jgi:hypothetical protein
MKKRDHRDSLQPKTSPAKAEQKTKTYTLETDGRDERQTDPRLLRSRHKNPLQSNQRRHPTAETLNRKNPKRTRKTITNQKCIPLEKLGLIVEGVVGLFVLRLLYEASETVLVHVVHE